MTPLSNQPLYVRGYMEMYTSNEVLYMVDMMYVSYKMTDIE